MKYFIICKYANADKYKELKTYLDSCGYEITHDWLAAEPKKKEPVYDDVYYDQRLRPNLDGIQDADIVYAILPGGQDFHVELGIAIALQKKIRFVYIAGTTVVPSAYYAHPKIEHLEDYI